MRLLGTLLWASLLCRVATDTITIEKVTCQHAATGIDSFAHAGIAALGAAAGAIATAVAGGAVVIGTGGVAVGTVPLTASAVVAAAGSGASAANTALGWIDDLTSGTDDLIININGEQVWPVGGGHGSIEAGDTIYPDVSYDFDGNGRIEFIEYDSGSDNDNLGSIDVVDDVSPGEDYRINEALLFSDVEGSLYKVTYRVERNDRGRDPKYMVCGTAACRECVHDRCCRGETNQGLDRDGDEEDLRACPPGFYDKGWKTYDLWWPADDVYLRICGNAYTPGDEWCSHTIEVDGWERRRSQMRRAQAVKREGDLLALRRLLNRLADE